MKKYIKFFNALTLTLVFLLCAFFGFAEALLLPSFEYDGLFSSGIVQFLVLIVAYLLQLVIHEAGHLVFGLATGYGFLSFRIGSFVIKKEEQGFSFGRFTIAGTAGQCLMTEPKMKNGKYPFALYNLGGVLMNLIVSAIFAVPLFLGTQNESLYFICLQFVMTGLIIAVSNGVPMSLNSVNNDGYNLICLAEDKTALICFVNQLKINRLQYQGKRLGEMPEALFSLPEDADLHNPLISTSLVFSENRLMDLQRFDEARERAQFLISNDCTVVGIYKALLKLDLTYIDILKNGINADLSVFDDKKANKVYSSMKTWGSVIRTKYATSLAKGNDKSERDALLCQFDKAEKQSPCRVDYISERELIKLVDDLFLNAGKEN